MALLLGVTLATKQFNFPRRPSPWNRVQFDEDENDEECLCNEFCIQGAKVITINLDNHCELENW
jgi:hypothetical protein